MESLSYHFLNVFEEKNIFVLKNWAIDNWQPYIWNQIVNTVQQWPLNFPNTDVKLNWHSMGCTNHAILSGYNNIRNCKRFLIFLSNGVSLTNIFQPFCYDPFLKQKINQISIFWVVCITQQILGTYPKASCLETDTQIFLKLPMHGSN